MPQPTTPEMLQILAGTLIVPPPPMRTAQEASWALAGVLPNAEPQPAPVPAGEPFDPLAGVAEQA